MVGKITIDADTTLVTKKMRVVAKHLEAMADELEGIEENDGVEADANLQLDLEVSVGAKTSMNGGKIGGM